MTDIYRNPRLYDLAFSYRDYSREAKIIELWFARHSRLSHDSHGPKGSSPTKLNATKSATKSATKAATKSATKSATKAVPKSVLELASGPARHALEFASHGCEVTALDSSASMCAYARKLAVEEHASMQIVRGNMIDFRLTRTFDLAITMLDSISHILTMRDMVKHLHFVGKNLNSGGIYVIETALESAQTVKTTLDEWEAVCGGERLRVIWSSSEKPLRGRRHVFQTRAQFQLTGSENQSFFSQFPQREWTRADLKTAIARCDSLKLLATYGAFEECRSFRAKDAWRAIYVLLKK